MSEVTCRLRDDKTPTIACVVQQLGWECERCEADSRHVYPRCPSYPLAGRV